MPLPFEGDPALLGRLLAGVSEVDQERPGGAGSTASRSGRCGTPNTR